MREINWVDGVVGLVLLAYVWQGWERRVFMVLSEMVSWVMAYVITCYSLWWLMVVLVKYLGVSARYSPVIAWTLLVVVAQQVVYRLCLLVTSKISRHYFSGGTQLVMGLLPSFLSGLLTLVYVMVVLMWLPFDYPAKVDIVSSWMGGLLGGLLSGWI